MNITSPISIVGLGRSGTTLLLNALSRHKDVQRCGETGGLIFSTWAGAEASYMPVPRKLRGSFQDHPAAKQTYYVRKVLKSLLPSRKPRWCQKPIGLPEFLNLKKVAGERGPLTSFPVEWYWDILERSFPNGKIVTVLRNPFDVMLSRLERDGWLPRQHIHAVMSHYEIYKAGWDRIDVVLNFEDLVSDFEGQIKGVCARLDIEFIPEMLEAAGVHHSPVEGRPPKLDHRDKWGELSGLTLSKEQLDCLMFAWEKIGQELVVPDTVEIAG